MTFSYSLSEINKASKFIFDNINSKIILFNGDLGTGKTTLIKNLCLKLGSTENVSSPTFPILNIYEDKKIKIYHADLYRVKNIKDLNELGFFEIINNDNWLFIEWPKQIIKVIDKPFSILNIEIDVNNNRIIQLMNNEL